MLEAAQELEEEPDRARDVVLGRPATGQERLLGVVHGSRHWFALGAGPGASLGAGLGAEPSPAPKRFVNVKLTIVAR